MTIASSEKKEAVPLPMREVARAIFAAGVEAVRPERLIPAQVSLAGDQLRIGAVDFRLRPGRQVHLFGSGKAAAPMARELTAILGKRLAGGCIVTNTEEKVAGLEVIKAGHPVPDRESLRGGVRLLAALSALGPEDFFIYLLSGGSSALIELPLVPLTLDHLQETSRLLLQRNVPIREVNTVRKHLSALKGGGLGQATMARGAVLVISDVVGDDLETIGSGPLYGDSSTHAQALEILQRAGLADQVPAPVLTVLREGVAGLRPETPTVPAGHISHFLIGTNRVALEAAASKARELGFTARLMTSQLEGEAEAAAGFICALGREIAGYQSPEPPGTVLLFGGETTVNFTGGGRGGRNQQLALAALARIKADPVLTLLSGGTDGIDGNSHAAGAVADAAAFRAAMSKGLDPGHYLASHDATSFFEQIDGLVVTGPTGTNVMDMMILIVKAKEES